MRQELTIDHLNRLLRELGRRSRGPGRVYLVGGGTALLHGWRKSTVDLDIFMDPEPAGVFEAIRLLKDAMQVNIELAGPHHFIPEVPGWRDRSEWIVRHNGVDFFHCDYVSQALAKLERAHERDERDVESMVAAGLVSAEELRTAFEAIRPALVRFPAIDEEAFRARVEQLSGGGRRDD